MACHKLPDELRGSTTDLRSSLVGKLLRAGRTVMLETGDQARLDELVWSWLPGLHTIALGVAAVGGGRTARSTPCSPTARPATSSWSCSNSSPGTPGSPSATPWPTRRPYGSAPTSARCSTPAPTASRSWTTWDASSSGTRPPPG
nr:hypothetical protein GCM10020093_077000 [Planobispora longispora]